MTDALIAPNGGTLVDRLATGDRARALEVVKLPDSMNPSLGGRKARFEPSVIEGNLGKVATPPARGNAGGPDDPVPQDLDELIRRATRQGDEQFLQRALDIIGDGGILTSDGFNFNANRFLK